MGISTNQDHIEISVLWHASVTVSSFNAYSLTILEIKQYFLCKKSFVKGNDEYKCTSW